MLSEFGLQLKEEDAVQLFDRVKSQRMQRLSHQAADDAQAGRTQEEEKLHEDRISCTAFHAYLVGKQ